MIGLDIGKACLPVIRTQQGTTDWLLYLSAKDKMKLDHGNSELIVE